MLKVSVIEPIGGHGGNEFYDFGLCEALCEAGIAPTLYTNLLTGLDRDLPVRFRVSKVFKDIFGSRPTWRKAANFLRGLLRARLQSLRRGERLAHLHIYHFDPRELVSILCYRWTGCRVVLTIHDVESFDKFETGDKDSRLQRAILRLADGIVVHNQFAAGCVLSKDPSLDPSLVSVVPSGDLDVAYNVRVPTDRARESLGIPQDVPVVLFFGQIKAVKGVDVLVRAAAAVSDTRTRFLVVGRPWKDTMQRYETLAKELGILDRIEFRSQYVPNDVVPLYFHSADVVVLPYKKIYNSSVLLRAMDYGTAVVASDLPVFQETGRDGQDILLFREGDPLDLAAKIDRMLADPDLRDRLRQEAKKVIQERHSPRAIGARMADVYARAVSRTR